MSATVKYHVATYSGEVEVTCDPNDETEYILAKAKRLVTRQAGGFLPFGSQSWKIINRD